uniref:Uncharacterized protein n=1 Tax=Panagrolaimus sp. JU765 TaxID=591449 RepID=A0AC34Q385_9BILA
MGKFKEWCSQHKTLITICSIVISIIFAVIIGIVIWQIVKNNQKPKAQPKSQVTVEPKDYPTTDSPLDTTTIDPNDFTDGYVSTTQAPVNEAQFAITILAAAFPAGSGSIIEKEHSVISYLIHNLSAANFNVTVTIFYATCQDFYFASLNGTELQMENLVVPEDEIPKEEIFNPCMTRLDSTIYIIPQCSMFWNIPKALCKRMVMRAKKEFAFSTEYQASNSQLEKLVKNIKATYNV